MIERITVKHTLEGIQHLIRKLVDEEGMSLPQLAKASGLHFTGLYGILKKKDAPNRRKIRRSTIVALAKAGGYDVKFDSVKNKIVLWRKQQTPPKGNDIDELVAELRSALLHSGKRRFEQGERQRIVNVFRAMVK